MNVLFLSPGYPGEMPHFTRGLAAVGARVIGLGDQPARALPPMARRAVSAHVQVPNLLDEAAVVRQVSREARRLRIDRVECLWEPGMLLAARIREELGVPGLDVRHTIPFRDKERMKQVLDAAGIRTPRHASARTARDCVESAERIGFPLIVKPIAGGGSADTHRVDTMAELEAVLPRLRHVAEVSVEEFIDGDEFTYDTVCAGGEVLYENIAWYRPRPLDEKKHEWLSPQTICLRRLDAEELRGGREMGGTVLRAMGFESGFSHMEWFRKSDGEVVFGEIGARPPGARMVDIMNYASDADLFTGWAQAVCCGRLSRPIPRRFNAAMVSKRAKGRGRIRRIEGLKKLCDEMGPFLVSVELLPVGSRRRNWKMTSIGDGYLIVRHPELQTTLRMADRIGRELRLIAG
jgi:biotin carboxylase